MVSSILTWLSKLKFTGIGAVVGSFSGFFYATSGLFAKLLKGRVQPDVISLSRTIFIMVYAIGMVIKRKENILGYKAKDYCILSVMAVVNISVIFAQNTVFQMINFSDAITLISSAPIFIVIFNCVCLCEMLDLTDVLTTFVCLVGVILCSQPMFLFHPGEVSVDSMLNGYSLSIMVAIGWGAVFIMIKGIEHVDVSTFLLLENGLGLMLLFGYLPFANALTMPRESFDILYLFCNSCFSLFASILLYMSLKLESAFMTSIGRTSEIALSFIFSVFIFNDDFNWMNIIGSVLVMLSIIARSLKGLYDARKEEAQPLL